MNVKQIARTLCPEPVITTARNYRNRRDLRRKASELSLAQAGQDFWVYGEVYNMTRSGFFVDAGAYDGVHLSNTFLLEKRYGWKGICIEGNPETFRQLRRNRSCTCINKCIDREQGVVQFFPDGVSGGIVAGDCDNAEAGANCVQVEAATLESILREEKAPSVIDYLSIDIEGAEDRALLEFPFSRYTFNCITIERPSEKLRGVLMANGFLLIKEIPGLDCFYIHASFQKRYLDNMYGFGKNHFLIRSVVPST